MISIKEIVPVLLKTCYVKCFECNEPLTPEEIAEATKEELKHPICNDCFADLTSQRYFEQRHPDE